MKISIVAVAVLITASAPAGFASTASEREYQRGYSDCLHGRYDQNQRVGWAERSEAQHQARVTR